MKKINIDDDLFELYYIRQNKSKQEVANILNVSISSIKRHIQKNKEKYSKTSEQILQCQKSISLKKYGVEFPAQSESVKEKTKDYFVNKYGVVNPFQLEEVKEKIKTKKNGKKK